MQYRKRACVIVIMAFLTFLIILATMPMTNAAGGITLTPGTQAPGDSVTVAGTGFGASKPVGIVFGAEISVAGEYHVPTDIGGGAYVAVANNYPIKPGSLTVHITFHLKMGDVEIDATDNGDGTISSNNPLAVGYVAGAYVQYVNGTLEGISTTDLTGIGITATIDYTYYQYNVTPVAGVTTDSSGAFSASITVPSVANGDYNVTAIDTQGNIAAAILAVDNSVPEGLTVGVMLAVSSVAVIVSIRCFRKRPRIENFS